MKCHAASPKSCNLAMSVVLLFLALIKLAIHSKEMNIFLEIDSKNSICPKIGIGWALPSQVLGSVGPLML